ncbi:MAG: 50S ribosomal protein L23 [Parcubacteria group bacterium]|nr:50S ribosomal protein L23 [Parcubacteria group bacterium]
MKNPFSKKEAALPRRSAQKELEAHRRADRAAEKELSAPAASGTRSPKQPDAMKRLEAGFGIILRPHVSEKTAHAGTYDTYAFVVSRSANKVEIKKAFWKMYGVKPVGVRISNVSPRFTYFRRIPGFKSAWKKAYVRVPKGSNILVYEGV